MKSSWVLCPVLWSVGCIAWTQVQVKRCRDDGFNFWDIAVVMVEEHNVLCTSLLWIASMWSIMKGTRRGWTASRGQVWLVKNGCQGRSSHNFTWRTIMTDCFWCFGSNAEFGGIHPNTERECHVLRHSSVQGCHKDHQFQRRTRKVRKGRRKRSSRLPRKWVDMTMDSRMTFLGMAQNKRSLNFASWAISSTAEIIKQKQRSLRSLFLLFQNKQIGNSFLQMWKEVWRIHIRTRRERSGYNGKRLPDHSITSTLSIYRTKSDGANATAHQQVRCVGLRCASMSWDAHRCRRPNHQTEDFFRRMRCSLGKRWSIHESREWQSWDVCVRKEFGDHADYQQARPLREQMLLGRLNIKQSADVDLLVRHHTEYHLAVQIVREREQKQEDIRRNPCRRSKRHTHLLRRRFNGMVRGRVRGGMSRDSGLNYQF